MTYFKFTVLAILLIDHFSILKAEISLIEQFFFWIKQTSCYQNKTTVNSFKSVQNIGEMRIEDHPIISYKLEGNHKTYRITKMLVSFLN